MLITLFLVSCQAADSGNSFFYLVETNSGIEIKSTTIPAGEMVTFNDPSIITFVLPFGIGQSGDLVKRSEEKSPFTVLNTGEEFKVTIKKPDGSERALPPVKLADLATYDMRINVSGVKHKKVFILNGYHDPTVDTGPVLDMFAGMIPMQKGDYSITTETERHQEIAHVYGSAPLEIVDGMLIVKGTLSNGTTGDFIVDLGAGTSGIFKDYLPEDAEITKLTAIEYSDKGTRELPGTMGGAGGNVESFLGSTVLSSLTVGDITFDDVSANVVDGGLDIGDRVTLGIIGLDLLQRADIIAFGYGDNPRLELLPKSEVTPGDIPPIRFTIASDHIFIAAQLDGVDFPLVLDTGARGSIISREIANRAKLIFEEGTGKQFKGLDGNPIPAQRTRIRKLTLDRAVFEKVPAHAANLEVLKTLGVSDQGGLLGADFLDRFNRIEVDFTTMTIRMWEK